MRALVLAALLATPAAASAQARPLPSEAEVKVVRYLRDHVRPGERVVVSQLYNEVFTAEAERAVLDRLFNTFFKMPLYLAQHQKAAGRPPTLAEISEQFDFRVEGEADVMLRILESDPRIPSFIRRNELNGEITSVNVDRILTHPRFGKALERTISGWEGREAPAWTATALRAATPSEPPICWLALTTALATPASRGCTPVSATLPSGTKIRPMPRPRTSSPGRIVPQKSAVTSMRVSSSRPPAPTNAPAAMTGLAPHRVSRVVATG